MHGEMINGDLKWTERAITRMQLKSYIAQPTEQDLENKKTFLEDNSQHPRKVRIA